MEIFIMEEADTSSIATTNSTFCKTQIGQIQHLQHTTTILPIKENSGCQKLIYLVIAYFLSVSIYYLIITLFRSKYFECQLHCSPLDLSCSCQLTNVVSWNASTYVELTWDNSQKQIDQINSFAIRSAWIDNNQNRIDLQSMFEIQYSCFPSQCLALVGIHRKSITEKGIFSMVFHQQLPFDVNQNPAAIFRQVNSRYPQLSTYSQLAISLILAVFTAVIAFLTQKIPVNTSFRVRRTDKLNRPEKETELAQIPAQIQRINNELQIHRIKAAQFLLPTIAENVLTYHLYGQEI